MGDEQMPVRTRLALHLIGGPWIIMGDLAGWDDARRADGSRLATFVVTPADVGRAVRWQARPGVLCDEWSGERRPVTAAEAKLGVLLDTSSATGLALSIHPR